jgi:dihydrodipicolinate synthase/N-acetylneuraminate lyase
LLSTANAFAKDYAKILQLLREGRRAEAETLSSKLSLAVGAAFALVEDYTAGNAFVNAHKLLDHCLGYGDRAVTRQPPMLIGGDRLPTC